MKNKNIIITGSEGLIGKSLTEHFKKLKANIFRIDIKKKKEKNFYNCDITKESQVKKCIGKIIKKNKIDILINSATFSKHSISKKSKKFKFSNYNLKQWKQNLDVDLIGSFLVSKYVCKQFEKNDNGSIINISSIYALHGPDQDIYTRNKVKKFYGFKPLEYSVAKAGMIGFTKALASFYKRTNIRVNCVVLGGIETKNHSKSFIKNYNSKTISNRMARAEEYNELVNFLSSEKSKYITGSCIVADGGATSII